MEPVIESPHHKSTAVPECKLVAGIHNQHFRWLKI